MARVLKILSYAVVLFLLYLVINQFVKSCSTGGGPIVKMSDREADESEDYFEYDEGSAEDIVQEEVIDYDKIDKKVEQAKTEKEPEIEADYTSQEKTSSEKRTPAVNQSYNTKPISNGSKYMVIAGSYIIPKNAENMVLRLKRLGYSEAEIVIFDGSKYHSTLAYRSDDNNSAQRIAREIKSKGIDCYVHTRK